MDKKQFSDEINELVESGLFFHEEFEVSLKSFHHLKRIEQEIRFLRRFNKMLLFATLALAGGVLFLLLKGDGLKRVVVGAPGTGFSSAVVDTIERLKSESKLLRERNSSLEQQIKTMLEQEPPASRSAGEAISGKATILHVVKKGETLYTIAGKYYGDKRMYKKILDDNGLRGEGDVYEGVRLKIIPKK